MWDLGLDPGNRKETLAGKPVKFKLSLQIRQSQSTNVNFFGLIIILWLCKMFTPGVGKEPMGLFVL